jgi:hypothetical protein
MKSRLKFLLVLVLVVCLSLGTVQVIRAAKTVLPFASSGIGWWVLSAGGGPSNGGTVTLNATLGQPIVGSSTGGSVGLNAGYWVTTSAMVTLFYLPVINR